MVVRVHSICEVKGQARSEEALDEKVRGVVRLLATYMIACRYTDFVSVVCHRAMHCHFFFPGDTMLPLHFKAYGY